MRLRFDGGTIVLDLDGLLPTSVRFDTLKWDERVGIHRGPAFSCTTIRRELSTLGFSVLPPAVRNDPPSLPSPKILLRPYQTAALSAWDIAGRRGTLVMPTGSGKTHVAMAALRIVACSTLILVPTRVLLRQWLTELEKNGLRAGILGDGTHDIQAITIATFESAYRHMALYGDRFEFLIVDEAHHFGGGVRDEALEMSLAPFRLGLTATAPDNELWQKRIGLILGPIVFELGMNDLRGSYLADYEVIRVHLELNPDERAIYNREIEAFRAVHDAFRGSHPRGSWQDFVFYAHRTDAGRNGLKGFQIAQKILFFPQAKGLALGNILARHKTDKVLVFTPDTATAYEVSRRHLVMPITADIGRKEREEALDSYRLGKIATLVSCQVLNEGFDVPSANVAVILGGRRGEREHLQRVGRILRLKDGRKAKIFELVCNRTLEIKQANRRGQKLDY